jgi:hypothetical protein
MLKGLGAWILLFLWSPGAGASAHVLTHIPEGDSLESYKNGNVSIQDRQALCYQTPERKDSLNLKTPKDSIPWPNPEIAWKLSLIPGGGQIYNKAYWKPPIIYAGLGVFSYLILDNHAKFKQFRQSYLAKTGSNRIDLHTEFSVEAVQAQRNYHRQTRDLLFMIGTFWYALNIVEAYVDAHLKHFDVSEKISLFVVPGPIYTPYTRTQIKPGIQASIHF